MPCVCSARELNRRRVISAHIKGIILYIICSKYIIIIIIIIMIMMILKCIPYITGTRHTNNNMLMNLLELLIRTVLLQSYIVYGGGGGVELVAPRPFAIVAHMARCRENCRIFHEKLHNVEKQIIIITACVELTRAIVLPLRRKKSSQRETFYKSRLIFYSSS